MSIVIIDFLSPFHRRRIPRTKHNLRELFISPLDSVFYGKLFALKVTKALDIDDEDEFIAVYAADDHEAYSYWMISFQDCKDYEEVEKKKLEEEMKAKLEEELAAKKRKEEEERKVEEERVRILEEQRKHAEIAEKAKIDADTKAKAVASIASVIAQQAPPAEEKPKKRKLSIKEKLEAQMKAKAAGLPMPNFDEEEEENDSQPANESKGIDSVSKVGSMSFVGPVVRVTDDNLDDMLQVKSVTSADSSDRGMMAHSLPGSFSVAAVAPPPPPEPVNPRLSLIEKLEFKVKKTTYPADRLSRRVKIWYCSSGFSLSSVDEIQQFVQELKSTGDHTLEAFADEKFDKINDWANLLEVLRKYEQRLLIEMPQQNQINNDVINVEVEIMLPDEEKKLAIVVNDRFSIEDLSKKVSFS